MRLIWDQHTEERQRRLRQIQPLSWVDYLIWFVASGIIAGVWIAIARFL